MPRIVHAKFDMIDSRFDKPIADDWYIVEIDAIRVTTDKAWLIQFDQYTQKWVAKSQAIMSRDTETLAISSFLYDTLAL